MLSDEQMNDHELVEKKPCLINIIEMISIAYNALALSMIPASFCYSHGPCFPYHRNFHLTWIGHIGLDLLGYFKG